MGGSTQCRVDRILDTLSKDMRVFNLEDLAAAISKTRTGSKSESTSESESKSKSKAESESNVHPIQLEILNLV